MSRPVDTPGQVKQPHCERGQALFHQCDGDNNSGPFAAVLDTVLASHSIHSFLLVFEVIAIP
ncbi:hypothetical protein RvY_11902 [Ramazzottius varieornatus]|uniref:Uncharacterized protein n=1 Tax=Ramazzottius varieornatus TaxID=947166 RepID=A0A1D1VHK9_RAMVA|nr:hypothetical protein RvY_11902 [Ramazzottius varieornatus]